MEQYVNTATAVTEKKTGLAIAALVLSIIGIFSYGILSIIAIIFGHISKSKINAQPNIYGGGGMATAGLILGYLTIGFVLLAVFGLMSIFT